MTIRSGSETDDAGAAGRSRRVGHRVRTVEAAAIAGIAYAVLSLIARGILVSVPRLDDPEVVDWFNDEGNQELLLLALNLTSLATVAFLWFVAVIRRRIGTREDQVFSSVFVGSGIVLIVSRLLATAAGVSPAIAARLLGGGELDSTEIAIAEGLGGAVALVVAPRMQAVFVIATSTVVLRSRAMPLWLAYLGYGLGLVLFVVPFVIEPMGLLFPAWVLLVSIVLLVTRTHELDDEPRPADTSS